MENRKQMALEILIAIRNNQTLPAEEFYKIFEYRWPDYRHCMLSLYHMGLLIHSRHDRIPGLIKWELTGAGTCRLTELLLERSEDLSKRLSEPVKTKNLQPVQTGSFLAIPIS